VLSICLYNFIVRAYDDRVHNLNMNYKFIIFTKLLKDMRHMIRQELIPYGIRLVKTLIVIIIWCDARTAPRSLLLSSHLKDAFIKLHQSKLFTTFMSFVDELVNHDLYLRHDK
jgi:hypothetical protein